MPVSHPAIQTVVAATDFSSDAAAAVDWAAEVARELSARLVVVHAVMIATPAGQEFIPLHERFFAELRAQAREDLDRLATTLRETGLAVETVLAQEPAAATILDAAAERHADLIVVGTRGLTGWKRIALGSVAARIVRKAPCPVVTVHADDAARHRPVRTILVATDFSGEALAAADAACAILGEGGPDRYLSLLHVYHYPMILTATAKPILTASPDEVIFAAHRRIEALGYHLARFGLRVQPSVIESRTPAEAILEEARRIKADLIAMGTHGRSGLDRLLLGSTAERVLSSAPCPILTVAFGQPTDPDS